MTTIIAEAGSNHNGDVELAVELARVAQRAGAEYCKYQFIRPAGLYLPVELDDYGRVVGRSKVFQQRESELLTNAEWKQVWKECRLLGIKATASVFDSQGIEFLAELGCDFVKIASCDLNNTELHGMASEAFQKVIISTGMGSKEEILNVEKNFRKQHPTVDLTYMFCTSLYPTLLSQVDFSKLQWMQATLGVDRVGYSDHTEGCEASIAAAVLGVRKFEKHFTLSKTMSGFDHKVALEEEELRDYVTVLRGLQNHDSDGVRAGEVDTETAIRARRGLYAARDIKAGEVVSRSDVLSVRPSALLGPDEIGLVVGKKAAGDVPMFQPLGADKSGVVVGRSLSAAAAEYWASEMKDKGM